MGVTIRQYAKSRHVSYEAVRRQVQRYEKELEGHTEKKKQAVYLDDEACDFLDTHRQKRSVVISDDNSKAEIELLQLQIDRLQKEKEELKDKIISLQDQQKFLDDKTMKLLEDKTRSETLYEVEHKELEQAKQELGKYHRSIFGFYRKDA